MSNPLPPSNEHHIVQQIRDHLAIDTHSFLSVHRFQDLDYIIKYIWLSECLDPRFFKEINPELRHTVLRKRKQLEDDDLLDRVGVNPEPKLAGL